MAKKEVDQEFLEFVVKHLVDNPDDVRVERVLDEMGVLLTLNVNPADMGTLIGRQGRTAQALRTLLRVLGAKNRARINLKLAEPEGGRVPPVKRAETPKPEPDKEKSAEEVVDDLAL
jgi:hypothetical protein